MKYSKVSSRSRPDIFTCIDYVYDAGLDELSHWLRIDKQFGYAVLFALIFLTTFRESFYHLATPRNVIYHDNFQLPFPCIR
jgi:hypothetical protein